MIIEKLLIKSICVVLIEILLGLNNEEFSKNCWYLVGLSMIKLV